MKEGYDMKNKIIIYTGVGADKKKIELYNFSEMKHVVIEGVSYIRINCEGKFYYYRTMITTIGEINIYEGK